MVPCIVDVILRISRLVSPYITGAGAAKQIVTIQVGTPRRGVRGRLKAIGKNTLRRWTRRGQRGALSLPEQLQQIIITGLLLLARVVLAGDPHLVGPEPKSVTAFVNVNVVPMDTEIVLPNQTVIVRKGRIVAVGPSAATPITPGANVIDGRGKYLMPGLADMHVHLEGRSGFGDAPLFLAYGITTVLNLRPASPEVLAWRREIREGRLLAPNLYSGRRLVCF